MWVNEVLTWGVPRHGRALKEWASDQEELSLTTDMWSAAAAAAPCDVATKKEANLDGILSLILRRRSAWSSSTYTRDISYFETRPGRTQQLTTHT